MTKSSYKRNNNNRPRHHHNNKNGGKNKNHAQNRDRYLDKAKAALASGDRVSAENFYQHAEHYARMVEEKELNNNAAANTNADAAKEKIVVDEAAGNQ